MLELKNKKMWSWGGGAYEVPASAVSSAIFYRGGGGRLIAGFAMTCYACLEVGGVGGVEVLRAFLLIS